MRKSGLTLAPEVARDDMREQIRKKIKNDDLYEGCREAFKNGWQRVKLYFLCGLPGERQVDLDGIVDMAETIARISKEVTRPLQGGDGVGVELRAQAAHAVPVERHADARVPALGGRVPAQARASCKSVKIKQHDVECSLLEGILTRGDRRVARGAGGGVAARRRLDGWRECFQPELWWQTFADLGIDVAWYSQRNRPMTEVLPWDHVNVKKGREYLEKEQNAQPAATAGDGRSDVIFLYEPEA